MKKSDYKSYLDKIKCSPEFRERMENNLSEEIEAGYADSVSSLEPARRGNSFHWTVTAASVLFLLIVGGIALKVVTAPVPQHSTDISSDDEEEAPDLAPRMLEDNINANEAVMKLFEENIGERYADRVHYVEGGGQFDGQLDFYHVDISELRSAVEALVWTECEKSENTDVYHFSVDGISINETGYIYYYKTDTAYHAAGGQDLSALEQALYNIRFSDPFNRIRNILAFDDLGSDTVEDEITFYYIENPGDYIDDNVIEPADVFGGTGKLYIDRKNGVEYCELEDQNGVSSEFYKNGRFFTYMQKGVDTHENEESDISYPYFVETEDMRYTTGFFGMGGVAIDYDLMRQYLSSIAEWSYYYDKEDSYYNYDDIKKITRSVRAKERGVITCDITVTFVSGSQLYAVIHTDSEDNIIYATMSYDSIYNETGSYPIYYFIASQTTFSRKLNSEDFEIPTPSDELLEVHREYLREEGVLESEDVRYDINE